MESICLLIEAVSNFDVMRKYEVTNKSCHQTITATVVNFHDLEAPYSTDTIYVGLQVILSGGVAPAHRHIAFALRFIIEGKQGFTAVEVRMIMECGNVILTPSWHWHDRGTEGEDPVVWLGGLNLPPFKDSPVNFALFAEMYKGKRYSNA